MKALTMDKNSRIFVAGHTGLVGSGLIRVLSQMGYANLLTRTHQQLELTDQTATEKFFQQERPEFVFLAAGLVGGIHRNIQLPANMIYVNLAIQTNLIESARKYAVQKLLFIGSACAYPKHCPQPMQPQNLLSSPLEPTNEPFALAKLAGIRMAQAYNSQFGTNFISVIPATIYGPNDHFDENAHVVAALIHRFHQAKLQSASSVTLWGSGLPRREFLFVNDAAQAMIMLMQNYQDSQVINLGTGQDICITELAHQIRKTVGFHGQILLDTTRPDGSLRRQLDCTPIKSLPWQRQTTLAQGLAQTYAWYKNNLHQ